MTFQFQVLAAAAQANGAVTGDDVLALRRAGWGDGPIDRGDAEAIFALNGRLAQRPPEWVEFFVDTLCEFMLAGGRPRGFVSAAEADWLIAQLDRDGRIETLAELDLLARLFDRAESLPERLRGYALAQIEHIVLTGSGPTRGGGRSDGACISAAECRLLRRFVFAFAGDGPGGVSQAEAEMLFRIKDATLGGANAADWPRLFVQGVANFLAAHQSFAPLSAERALELDGFLNQATPRVSAFFRRMAGAGLGKELGDWLAQRQRTTPDHAAAVLAARTITASEQAWLQQQIEANRQIDELERELLRFLAEDDRG